MQNPVSEIRTVVSLLAASKAPEIQKAAFLRYLTPNAGFRHPLCSVAPGPGSRDRVLGIYQWYRILSPHIDMTVNNVVHDADNHILLLDVVQVFHLRITPFKPAPARLLVRLTLQEGPDGLHYIAFQEDFYHPDDFLSLIVPPLVPLVGMGLILVGTVSHAYAKIGQFFGFWSSYTDTCHSGLYDEDKRSD